VAISALTFIVEAIGLGIAFKRSPLLIVQTWFEFDYYSIRPGWLVLAVGLCVVALDLVRARFAKPRRTSAPKPAIAAKNVAPRV
jgi:hypothetical protein